MKSHLLLAASLVAAPVFAADPAPTPTVMTITGEPGASMQCHVFPRNGDEYVRFLDNGRTSLSAPALRKLECEYKGSSHGPATITINSPTLACPFKGATADACAITLRKGAVGSFEAKEKRN
ncbi:hypothetical protein [Sphingomonas sp. CARO-RG-8B-R24-01]|uniref:hypothetical protein n=1 Tax=Sphingomonas sp. CARO-RG-8B-R24-01 TaxID=2914831 RepID=UPI0011F8A959|nr:hypothetical protein [Sphingomonas sp. CARO-RG-8B-R24-01]RZL78526.1 MAG: hypothetical protein EOP66_07820 [Sphingomonas sp.]